MCSENPNDRKSVYSKHDAEPSGDVSETAKVQTNHRKEAETVDAEQNTKSAANNPRPISGLEKTDGSPSSKNAKT